MTLQLVQPPSHAPHDVEVEQALIGTLLADSAQVDEVSGFLKPEHFFEPLHGRIYKSILACRAAGRPASVQSLKQEFSFDRALAELGGVRYIMACVDTAPTTIHGAHFGRLTYDFATKRALIELAADIDAVAKDTPSEWSSGDLMQMAESKISELSRQIEFRGTDTFKHIGGLANKVVDDCIAKVVQPSVLFGLRALDDLTGGMHEQEVIVVGGRPGMGKTAFAAQVAMNAAEQGHAVAFFSMEMPAVAIVQRCLTSIAYRQGSRIAYEALRKGRMDVGDADALVRANAEFTGLPIWIHEGRTQKPSSILSEAYRMQRQAEQQGQRLGLIIVDHIQKVLPERDMRGNKVAEVTEVSDALQKMAGALKCPVIALSQLNRGVEGREDKRPELRDLRESGSIEQDADVVLLLHREAYYLKKKEPDPYRDTAKHNEWMAKWRECRNQLEIQVAKQRNGPEGKAEVFFDAPSSAIKDK